MRKLDENKSYDLSELTRVELKEVWKYLTKIDEDWYTCPFEEVLSQSKTDVLSFNKQNWEWDNSIKLEEATNAREVFYTLENIQVDCSGLTEEQIDEMLNVVDNKLDPPNSSFDVDTECIYLSFNKFCRLFGFYGFDVEQYEITYENFMELFGRKEETKDILTLKNIQVDCRELSEVQIKEMCKVFEANGYKMWDDPDALKVEDNYIYLRVDWTNEFYITGGEWENKTTITYEKFMELFGNKEKSVEFDLTDYSVEVDNESQASLLQESAFKQGFRWIGGGEKILHTSKKYFQFKGKTIYWKNEHPDNLKRIHFNNIFAPKYEVTMMDEKPKEFQNLLNEESYKETKPQHYSKITDTFARMEANCTIEECLAFAKGSIDSYNWSTKEQSKEDFEKIISYANWVVRLILLYVSKDEIRKWLEEEGNKLK